MSIPESYKAKLAELCGWFICWGYLFSCSLRANAMQMNGFGIEPFGGRKLGAEGSNLAL